MNETNLMELEKIGYLLLEVNEKLDEMKKLEGTSLIRTYTGSLDALKKVLILLLEIEIEDGDKRYDRDINGTLEGIEAEGDTFTIDIAALATENNPSVRAKTDYHAYEIRHLLRRFLCERGISIPVYERAQISYEITLGRDRKMIDLDNVLTKYITDSLEGLLFKSDCAEYLVRHEIRYMGRGEKSHMRVVVKGVAGE